MRVARAAPDRRGARLLRRAGPRRSRRGARSRAGRPRRVDRAQLPAAGALAARACRCRWCARSTAWPPAPARTSRSPATSSSPRKSASFIQAFSRIGLVPDSGGTWFLPRLVGTARAMGLAHAGRAALGRAGRRMGADLEVRRRRRADSDRRRSCCAPWRARRPRARRDQARARRRRRQQPRSPARPRTRPAARCSAAATITAKGVAAFIAKRAPRFGGHSGMVGSGHGRAPRRGDAAGAGAVRAVVAAMYARDRASQALGMRSARSGPGAPS